MYLFIQSAQILIFARTQSFSKLCMFKTIYHRALSMNIKTFVFCDCETTGLPSLECGKTKITELCMVAVESDHLRLGVFPRIQNKINLCFNPKRVINPEVSNMTGLYNDLLEHQPTFNTNLATVIQMYLQLFRSPICLVAHNGKRFDYPILRKHFDDAKVSLPEDLYCIDSLETFRSLHNSIDIASSAKTTQTDSKIIPFEFTDGYDDALNDLADKIEEEVLANNSKTLDPQTINETTPKRPIRKYNMSKTVSRRLSFGVSFKLTDVYSRLMKKQPIDAHKAECDVDMLVQCAATLGEKFTDWANNNATLFAEVMPISVRTAAT